MKVFRSLPNGAPRSHRRFEHPGMPGEGSFLQMPSSGSKLAAEGRSSADVGLEVPIQFSNYYGFKGGCIADWRQYG